MRLRDSQSARCAPKTISATSSPTGPVGFVALINFVVRCRSMQCRFAGLAIAIHQSVLQQPAPHYFVPPIVEYHIRLWSLYLACRRLNCQILAHVAFTSNVPFSLISLVTEERANVLDILSPATRLRLKYRGRPTPKTQPHSPWVMASHPPV
ncbi:hypothetical protein B0H11DRAFT_1246348 [Mycena galericulata]|nr:hypothetical protein B0H11DRAFT_1246348 [Mycena galericulata]